MTRLLIVDDEHHIVNYLVSLFEEHTELDLDIYKAYSGFEALKILETLKIDLILLDIHMPGLSGLEVAEKICTGWPKCRIIFLTAYDNFNYIYQANRFNHSSYLLKTESDEKILEEVVSIIKDIVTETTNLCYLSEAKQKAKLLAYLLQQNILKEILAGQDISKLKPEVSLVGDDFVLNLSKPVYLMYMQVHGKDIKEYSINISEQSLQYIQLMEQLLCEKFLYSMLDLSLGSMLLFFQPSETFSQAISSPIVFLKGVAEDFISFCNHTLHSDATLILYPSELLWSRVCDIHHILRQYADTLTYQPTQANSFVVLLREDEKQQLTNNKKFDRHIIDKQYQKLSFYLYQGLQTEFLKVLAELRQICVNSKSMNDISSIKVYTTISSMLLNYIDQYQLQEKLALRIAIYPLYYIQDLQNWNSAFSYLHNLCVNIFELSIAKKMDKNELIVNTIKNYIRENIQDNLTLVNLSELVNYNESYISRLFKQVEGIGLSEYINQQRLAKAKNLLSSTNQSIQNIAAATGFDTSQYFSSVFKKGFGISPSEFRNLYTI